MNSSPVSPRNSVLGDDVFQSFCESSGNSKSGNSKEEPLLSLNGIEHPTYNEKTFNKDKEALLNGSKKDLNNNQEPLFVNDKKSVKEIYHEKPNEKHEENNEKLGGAKEKIIQEHKSFKKATGSVLNKKGFFTKTLEVLKKAGDVLWTPFNTEEKRKVAGKVLMLALAIAALVGATVLTGGAAGALVGLAAAGVAIASLDLASSSANYHMITHGKAGMRFAEDAIAGAIYYLSNKIIDKTKGHRSEAEQTARRETAAKASHYISLITRAALAGATAGITGLAAPLDPTLLQMNTHDKVVGGSINIVKALGDLLLKALTAAVPKEPTVPTVPKKPEEPEEPEELEKSQKLEKSQNPENKQARRNSF